MLEQPASKRYHRYAPGGGPSRANPPDMGARPGQKNRALDPDKLAAPPIKPVTARLLIRLLLFV